MLKSFVGDYISGKTEGADTTDSAFWEQLLTRKFLDGVLQDEVMPSLLRSVADLEDDQKQLQLEALARRESVIAGSLLLLAGQKRTEVLHRLFSAPSAGTGPALDAGASLMLDPLASFDPAHDWNRVGLSPVGIVHLFRQYFFEFDTFLGPPLQHLWLSPGGTVERGAIWSLRRALNHRCGVMAGRAAPRSS